MPHAFLVTSPETRFLTIQTPGTDGAFYRIASEPAPPGSQPIPVDFDRIADAARQTDAIEILGSPSFWSVALTLRRGNARAWCGEALRGSDLGDRRDGRTRWPRSSLGSMTFSMPPGSF